MTYLKHAVLEGDGFVVITGKPGTGKTTLIAALLTELDSTRVHVATLSNVFGDSADFLSMVLEDFHITLDVHGDMDIMSVLERYLLQQYENGRRCILVVDEAQCLSSASFEELKLIADLRHENNLLLQVFLVGQDPLMDKIRESGLDQLHQHFVATSHLRALDSTETEHYIKHRLHTAGWENDPVFAVDVMNLVHMFSGGVPRLINLICHRLFLYGSLKQKHKFAGADVMHVVAELNQEGLLSSGTNGLLGNNVGAVKLFPVESDMV